MPPLRTLAKPVKTERTHEENQERAYIAASRRSDRSLEARVESARRASEIHKRRTGRSLRVTEQDVVDEEMYEEEDDDLPMQYRRLTAHLQTTNADFDRRLAAYLTNHVAMRTALGQAVSDSYMGNQYPNASQFANQPMNQVPIGIGNQGIAGYPNPMLPPQMMPRSSMNYRQAPYPVQNGQASHMPSQTIANPQQLSAYQQQQPAQHASPLVGATMDGRRMSLPAQNMMPTTPQSQNGTQLAVSPTQMSPTHMSPVASRSPSSSSLNNLKHDASAQGHSRQKRARLSPSSSPIDHNQPSQQPTPPQQQQQRQHQSYQQPIPNLLGQSFASPFSAASAFNQPNYQDFNLNPFTTALPMESQQLLGLALDPNDPLTSNFMQGSMNMPGMQQPFYFYNPNGSKGKSPPPSAFDGMNQTLAPSALNTNLDEHDLLSNPQNQTLAPSALNPNLDEHGLLSIPQSAATDSHITPFTGAAYGYDFDNTLGDLFMASSSSGQQSGNVTPAADREWQSFIEGGMWDEQPVA